MCVVCSGGFEHFEDSMIILAIRSEKNSAIESTRRGITPCARGDSLLKILAEAGKFAGGSGRVAKLSTLGSASMFSPSVASIGKLFEV